MCTFKVEIYSPPVINTNSTPNFLLVEIFKDIMAGMGRMKRYQSITMPITPVGIEKFENMR